MRFYNINNPGVFVSMKEAVLTGIQGTDGLFMPEFIPAMEDSFFEKLPQLSMPEIAFEVSKNMLGDEFSNETLRHIASSAFNFEIPLLQLEENKFVLELFHGPTLAFKDVGARFMACIFEEYLKTENQKIHILVATSGDTGGAVANAFHNKVGISVTILYPKGMVSPLQELQLTTLGGNVSALEVAGTFDDCQHMVKQAFSDNSLTGSVKLASANSINFARLFPQSFYYFYALGQINSKGSDVVVSVPSGNFGNLTAGLLAKKMGLKINHFIAANNANKAVSDYLHSGEYHPAATIPTISNAMDVGKPSNFSRMMNLYHSSFESITQDVSGFSFSDTETQNCMRQVYQRLGYVLDPHGAVGYLALESYLKNHPKAVGVFLETAHPTKFKEVVEETLHTKLNIPTALSFLQTKESSKRSIEADYGLLKEYLLS